MSTASKPGRRAKSPAVAWSSALPASDQHLRRVLTEARELGFLGPGPVETHVEHARAYLPQLPVEPATVVDLGTGGGVPGLILASWRPDLTFRLVDAMMKRVAFVERAAKQLGLDVDVVCERAEVLGRDADWRQTVDVIVTRSLAAAAVTAEYIAPLLRVGGYALIAEPPAARPSRWPPEPLASLGMTVGQRIPCPNATLQRLDQVSQCPDTFPRKPGMAAKRPLYRDV